MAWSSVGDIAGDGEDLAILRPGRTADDESQSCLTASLSGEGGLPPRERKIRKVLKADEATHIDEMVESPEADHPPPKFASHGSSWNWQAR